MRLSKIYNEYYGIIIFVFFGILLIPAMFYVKNVAGFSFDVFLLIPPVICSLAVVFIFGLIRPALKGMGQSFFSGLGIAILLCDQFFSVDISPLNGMSDVISKQSEFRGLLGLAFFFTIIVIPCIFGKRLKRILVDFSILASVFCGCLLLYATAASVYSLSSNFGSEGRSLGAAAGIDNEINAEAGMPNIYIVWLDAMETKYARSYMELDRNGQAFNGFTLFSNNSSNYLYTAQSFPSFMSSTVFQGGDSNDYSLWVNNGGNELKSVVKSLGYKVSSYAKDEFTSTYDDYIYSPKDALSEYNQIEHVFISDFIHYWVVRSVPVYFSEQSSRIGSRLGAFASGVFNGKKSVHGGVVDGLEPLSGVYTLNKAIDDEGARSAHGEFVILNPIIPHGPYVIDKNCEYRGGVSSHSSQAYSEQVHCALDKTAHFFAKLKEYDRYDSSLIVIMGDHGAGWAGLDASNTEPLNNRFIKWSKSMMISRASALLMVKRPVISPAQSKLQYSEKESQLIDLYPTILAGIGKGALIHKNSQGIDLFSRDDAVERSKEIVFFKPSSQPDFTDAEIYSLSYKKGLGITSIDYKEKFIGRSVNHKPIACGAEVVFSDVRDAVFYKAKGLSGIEAQGRWSDGFDVVLDVLLPAKECVDNLVLDLRAFLKSSDEPLISQVSVNGHGLDDLVLGSAEFKHYEIKLENEYLEFGKINEIRFKINNPISPKMLQLTNDERMLGIQFRSMSFR